MMNRVLLCCVLFFVTSLQDSITHQLISPHLNFSSALTRQKFVTLTPSGSMFSTAVAHYLSFCIVFRVSISGSNFLLVFMEIHLYVGSFVHMNVPFLLYPFRYKHNGNTRFCIESLKYYMVLEIKPG